MDALTPGPALGVYAVHGVAASPLCPLPSIPRRMQEYVRAITAGQHLPQQKFVGTILPAMLASHSLVLGRIGETLMREGGARSYNTAEVYLSRNLRSKRLNDLGLLEAYLGLAKDILQRKEGAGVNVAVDGTDYAKPFARPNRPKGMEGCWYTHDGSASKKDPKATGMGFPGIMIEASTPEGNQIPLLHRLFSRRVRDPLTGKSGLSDNQFLADGLKLVASTVGSRAMWSFDSGFFGAHNRRAFDELNLRWIVRIPLDAQGGKLLLQTEDGFVMGARDLAYTIQRPYVIETTEGAEKKPLTIRMGLIKVRDRLESGSARRDQWSTRERTLVVAQFNDHPVLSAMLCGEWLGDSAQIVSLLHLEYKRRWRIEESFRLSKDTRGWGGSVERFQVLKLRAIQRVVLLWMMACGFVAWMRDMDTPGMLCLALRVHAPGSVPKDPRYRIYRAIGSVFAKWLPTHWRKTHAFGPRGPPPAPDEETLRRRLKNARRAVERALRAARKAGLSL